MSVNSGYAVPQARKVKNLIFAGLCLVSVMMGVIILFIVLYGAMHTGITRVSPDFLVKPPSMSNPDKAGVGPALWGSLWIVALTLLFSVPFGIAAAIYLEELTRPSKFKNFVLANISNLAGVPSIIYGILGLAVFVRWLGMGNSILAASLTMSLLVLPTVILVTQESLRMVPRAYREASLALGATKWQTLFRQILPNAFPTILTGIIFSASRAIGETAPLIVVGAVAFIRRAPQDLSSSFTVMPLQIYNWSKEPTADFQRNASAAIVVLLVSLLTLNLIAIVLRNKYRKV
ncbi:MAG: phosphate ABC transporter permease PstA [Armatimonadetes bacterium]|nr:phosphate ABC transporter permease PstA [Armatimonadota bacterium]